MKRIIYVLFALLLAVGCAQEENVVTIGVISPMTGAGAACSSYWLNGFNLAIEKLNEASDGLKYKVLFEDCQSNPAEAVNCYKRLEMKGVKYYVAVGGQFAMAVAPLTKGKDVILFTTADYNEAILKETERAIRLYPSGKNLASVASGYLVNELGAKNIAVVTMNSVANLLMSQIFVDDAAELGAKIVYNDTYAIGQSDFKDMVTKMSPYQIDAVLLTGFGQSPSAFCNQLATNMKFRNTVIIGDVNLYTADFIESMKNNPLTVYYSDSKLSDEFDAEYKAAFGTESNSLSSCAYVIPFLFRDATAASDDIDEQLSFLKGRTFDTAVGKISIDSSGNTEMPMATYRLK